MRISKEFLQELCERVPLSSVVGRVVTWDRRKSQPGKQDFWACCPFHEEKTPSFHVDDRKGFYHCFGCHQSGDHVRFLMDHQGLGFLDAVRSLADEAGVALPEPSAEDRTKSEKRDRIRDALALAGDRFVAQLWSAPGRDALSYARSRGFSDVTLREFGFGYAAAAVGSLTRELRQASCSADEILDAGLTVRTDRGELRERFRGRLTVPIHDGQGRVVGFGGRSIDGREPKYLNSPETRLFDKSSLLFNLHRARSHAHRANRLYVVEGYLDAVALCDSGLPMTVASLGTALTEAQIKLAWRLAEEPILCFDGDNAGRAAAMRAVDRILPLLEPGRSFQFLTLPEGQDPDDVVRAGGSAAFESLAQRARTLVDVLFERETQAGAKTPERLAALNVRLEALAASISDQRVAGLYREVLRERAYQYRRIEVSGKTGGKAQSRRPGQLQAPALRQPAPAQNSTLELERIVLGLAIARPALLDAFGERLSATKFASAAHQALAAMLVEAYGRTLAQGPLDLLADLPDRAHMCVSEVWGDVNDERGARLLSRFSILAQDPDSAFVERCVDVFLQRLRLLEERGALQGSAEDWLRADGATHGSSLRQALEGQETALAQAERELADEAAALRRKGAADAAMGPSDQMN
ncbi:MAG: DNA primase [Pseudomonadota bacterium]